MLEYKKLLIHHSCLVFLIVAFLLGTPTATQFYKKDNMLTNGEQSSRILSSWKKCQFTANRLSIHNGAPQNKFAYKARWFIKLQSLKADFLSQTKTIFDENQT